MYNEPGSEKLVLPADGENQVVCMDPGEEANKDETIGSMFSTVKHKGIPIINKTTVARCILAMSSKLRTTKNQAIPLAGVESSQAFDGKVS